MVTLEGTIEDEPRAVYARVTIHASGAEDLTVERNAAKLTLRTAEGRRITVTCAPQMVAQPRRELAGPWRELVAHPVAPDGNFHPDGHVRMRGVWVVPGDRVCVIGEVTDEDFVPDTGGQREAPEREVSKVEVVAIGVGDDAAADARDALARYEKAARPVAPKQPRDPRMIVLSVATALGVLAAGLIGVDLATHAGTLGAGLTVAFSGLLFYWCAAPKLTHFPGGARDAEGGDDNEPVPYAVVTSIVAIPCAAILAPFGDTEGARNAGGAGGLVLIGILPLWKVWSAVLMKPRAVAGAQVMLPADATRRRIVLVGMLVVYLASVVVAIAGGDFSGD